MYIWIITLIISSSISIVYIYQEDRKHMQLLEGHSLDNFVLWAEQLQSEVDITNKIDEYHKVFITIAMIIFAYAKNVSPRTLQSGLH